MFSAIVTHMVILLQFQQWEEQKQVRLENMELLKSLAAMAKKANTTALPVLIEKEISIL